jgi:leucyl aminopeptidase
MKGLSMKISAAASFDDAQTSQTHVIGVFAAEEANGALRTTHDEFDDFLAKLAADDAFKGRKAQTYFVRALDDASPNLLFVGFGKPDDVTAESYRLAGANVTKKLEAEKIKAASVDASSFSGKGAKVEFRAALTAFAEGMLLAQYRFDLYKSEKTKPSLAEVTFFAGDKKRLAAATDSVEQATATADAIHGITCKVLDVKALQKEKMGGIIGVGQGSENPPCCIVLEYKPKNAKKTIAFVGKAVTFDTGGISLKPGAGMEDMKHDMSGGADVLAATLLIAKRKLPVHLVCIIPSAENMPDGRAIVPSCILVARSGKTVEVQNTDAEGRLILMDALDYAQDWNPDVIVDVATLTGAVVMALSSVAAGLMGNDDKAIAKWKAAAAVTEERYVELPLFQEYSDDIKSKIADIKNMGGDKGAGSQKAAAFLKEFIRKGNKWIHLDVAGTAWTSGKLAYDPANGASGHTVRTLAQFAEIF